MLIEVDITHDQVERAKKLANIDEAYGSSGYLENQNKTGKRAGVVGSLGEVIIADNIKNIRLHEYDNPEEMYNYDLLWEDKKYDVKSMFVFKKPKLDKDACTTAYWNQKPEGFIFVYILRGFKKGWIGGHITYDDFYEKAQFIKRGTKRPDGFTYKWDNYVCKIRDLNKFTNTTRVVI